VDAEARRTRAQGVTLIKTRARVGPVPGGGPSSHTGERRSLSGREV